MRLNAATMSYEEHKHYMIRDYNGNDVDYCLLLDTDEGYAICAIAVPTGYRTEDDTLKRRPLFTYDSEGNNETLHTYTLHTFELWDVIDNVLIAKV